MKTSFARESRILRNPLLIAVALLGMAGFGALLQAAVFSINGGALGAVHVDFDGDRTTDLAVARDEGGAIRWYTLGSTSGFSATPWGVSATDFIVPADYDGDGKVDVAIWRPGAQGTFYILQSSDGMVRIVPWGVTGDDPAVVADYDGDGKADPAIYRCPSIGSGDGQCYFWVLGSMAGTMTVPWGFGEQFDFFANPGDYDGDGKADFCIQATNPSSPGSGLFYLLKSGGGVEYVHWGRNNDIIVPGDYDGDGKSDFMVSRTETIGGNPGRSYYLLTRTGGGTGGSAIRWGIAGDVRAPGDYDGDGKMDIAIWRPSATPGLSAYWVLRSSNGGLIYRPFGAMGDYAVASWAVH